MTPSDQIRQTRTSREAQGAPHRCVTPACLYQIGFSLLLALHHELVQGGYISAGRGDHGVGIGATSRNDASVLGEANGDFGLSIGALGHGMDLVEFELSRMRH